MMSGTAASSYGSVPIAPQQRHQQRDTTTRCCCCCERNQPTSHHNVSVLVAAFLASLATGGPTYAFGLYGSTLKQTLLLRQSELDTISSANFCAGLLSWIPGMCVDKWGSKAAMAVGGILECVFLMAYWVAAAIRFDETTPHTIVVPTLSVLGICIFMSNSLVIGGLFKVIVVSCGPGSKGSAVGAAKGYLGLGAGTYSSLFDALFRENSDLDFLPMAAFFCLVAIAMPSLLLVPNKLELEEGVMTDVSTPMHYRTVYTGLLILAVLVVGTSASFLFQPLPENVDSFSQEKESGPDYVKALLIILAWFGPILALFFLPQSSIRPADKGDNNTQSSCSDSDQQQSRPLVTSKRSLVAENPTSHFTLTEMLKTPQAWLLLWACTILVGSGTIMTNNMGQMVEALGFPSRAASGCLALFSVAQAVARVVAGSISESALSWNKPVSRPAFLVLSSMIAIVAHSVLATSSSSRKGFVTGVVLVGTSFGMVWPLMVLIVGEVFGTRNHGANYMFYDGFTSAMGTLLISKYVAQEVYEAHIDPADEKMDDITCYGSACFQLSHVIAAALCFTSLMASAGVLHMTRSVYGRASATPHTNDVLYGSPYVGRPNRRMRESEMQ